MCEAKSAVTCSKVTIAFSSVLLLGMLLAVAAFNAMFGPNLQCYVDANDSITAIIPSPPPPPPPTSRRALFEAMDRMAASHTPTTSSAARARLALWGVARSLHLVPMLKQLPDARFTLSAEHGRQLSETTWYGHS